MHRQQSQHVGRSSALLSLPDWVIFALFALFILFVVGVGYATFTGVKNFVANGVTDVSGGPILSGDPASGGVAAGDQLPGGEDAPLSISGRVVVLVMGIDERESEQGPWRTDTMILLTIDPVNNTAGMLSIPRDVWVDIPDYSGIYDRINTAYFRGDADNYPGGGGPALAMKTVRQNFGVPVNYFVTVNFHAFVEVVDRLGCITINVPQTINDPTYPEADGTGYDPFTIEAGEHCMDGETLLKYARTRATYGGDFDRAARQQQVLHAIRKQVLSSNQLPALLAQAPEIYNSVQDDIRTNLSLTQLVDLARLASRVPDDAICSAVINGEYVDLVTMPNGDQVLIPDKTKVRVLVSDIFSNSGHCKGAVEGEPADAVTAEQATVYIVNGTRQEGLATETADKLNAAGINVMSVGNADRQDYEYSIIYDYTGKLNTAQYIAQLLGLPETAVVAATGSTSAYDIEVVLGSDYQP
jgi:LCP family protein required for cell wall assembly